MIELPLANTQPSESLQQSHRGNGQLDVVEIFATIQGEGPFTGERAVFVRLAGCNLQCPNCDTDYTTNRKMISYAEIHDGIIRAYETFGVENGDLLVVITGGEPLRQDIGPFLTFLFNNDPQIHIQIETNGTLYRDDIPWFALNLSVVCSPKGGSINSQLIPHIMAYKYALEAGKVDPEDGLPLSHLGNNLKVARPPEKNNRTVYVQPMDGSGAEGNCYNLQACVDSCKKFGHRVGIQLHKFLELP